MVVQAPVPNQHTTSIYTIPNYNPCPPVPKSPPSMAAASPTSSPSASPSGCACRTGESPRGRYEDAITGYNKAMIKDPNSPLPYWGLGKSLTQLGRFPEAVESLNRFSERNGDPPPMLIAECGYALARWGKRNEARARLEQLSQLSKTYYVNPYFFALIHFGLDERDLTFQWLSKAADDRSTFLVSILSDPKWDSLRSDPRVGAIVARMRTDPSSVTH